MNNLPFDPQGLPEYSPILKRAEEKWKLIVFKVEEIEGKVPTDKYLQDNLEIRRTKISSGYEDHIKLKGKSILKFFYDRDGNWIETIYL